MSSQKRRISKENEQKKRRRLSYDNTQEIEEEVLQNPPDEHVPITQNENNIARANSLQDDYHETGIIEEIYLENFMNHKKFQLELNKRVNIITGKNGSGKSAILTGLQICLGCKAGATSRGKSLADLIRKDQKGEPAGAAVIRVRISNKGKDSYKTNTYGNSIVIERRINPSGSSSYKIKSEKGTTVSTAAAELKRILRQFNIFIDNPVQITTQNTSRDLLRSCSEEALYRFFMDSCQLSEILDEQRTALNAQEGIQKILRTASDDIQQSEKRLAKERKKLEICKEADALQVIHETYFCELQWAKVVEIEQQIERLTASKKAQQDSTEECTAKCAQFEEQLQQMEQDRMKVESEISELHKQIVSSHTASQDKEMNQLKSKRSDITSKINSTKQEIEIFHKAITKLKAEIQEIRNSHKSQSQEKELVEEKKREITEELERITASKLQHTAEVKNAEQSLATLRSERSEVEKKVKERKAAVSHLNSTKTDIEQSIVATKQSKQSRINYFGGKQLYDLLHEVKENCSLFQGKGIIGPIGLCIKVKEASWSAAVERALGGALKCFITQSFEDTEQLKRIARRVGYTAVIIQQPFKTRRYSSETHRPNKEAFITIEDVIDLDIDSVNSLPLSVGMEVIYATVFNCLIDQNVIDRDILVEDTNLAKSIMFPKPPENVSSCYTKTGVKVFVKGKSQVIQGSTGETKLYNVDYDSKIFKLEASLAEVIEKIKQADVDKRRYSEELAKIDAKIEENEKTYSHMKLLVTSEERRIVRLKNDLETLRIEHNDVEIEIQEKVELIQKKIDEKQSDIEASKDKIRMLQEEVVQVEEQIRTRQSQLSDIQAEKRKLGERMKRLESQLTDMLQQIGSQQKKLDKMKEMKSKYAENIGLLDTKIERLKKQLDPLMQDALQGTDGERIQPSKSRPELEQEVAKSKQIYEAKRRNVPGDSTEITRSYNALRLQHETKKTQVEAVSSNAKKIQEGFKERFKRFLSVREMIQKRMKQKFALFISQRGHEGNLMFNDDVGKLQIGVEIASHDVISSSRNAKPVDLKSLSGGERSFTTVSFLLSIWEVAECPFRALDEFDVFMDSVHMKISMDMIITTALQRHPTRQLIIITPNQLMVPTGVSSEDVKIFQLQDPARGSLSMET